MVCIKKYFLFFFNFLYFLYLFEGGITTQYPPQPSAMGVLPLPSNSLIVQLLIHLSYVTA